MNLRGHESMTDNGSMAPHKDQLTFDMKTNGKYVRDDVYFDADSIWSYLGLSYRQNEDILDEFNVSHFVPPNCCIFIFFNRKLILPVNRC